MCGVLLRPPHCLAPAHACWRCPPALTPAPGPNDRKLGKQYVGDPSVDESKLLLSQYSLLQWVERFPHWKLTGEAAAAVQGWWHTPPAQLVIS